MPDVVYSLVVRKCLVPLLSKLFYLRQTGRGRSIFVSQYNESQFYKALPCVCLPQCLYCFKYDKVKCCKNSFVKCAFFKFKDVIHQIFLSFKTRKVIVLCLVLHN